MTREEALTGHRKLWNEIADMIERGVEFTDVYSYEIKGVKFLGEERDLLCNCYLCEYIDNHEEESGFLSCEWDCPVKWYGVTCCNPISEYKLFENALCNKDYTQAAILARTIANLPERVVE